MDPREASCSRTRCQHLPSVLRSAGLPVFLIGSPINYANCLIGSSISWHTTGSCPVHCGVTRAPTNSTGKGAFRSAASCTQLHHALQRCRGVTRTCCCWWQPLQLASPTCSKMKRVGGFSCRTTTRTGVNRGFPSSTSNIEAGTQQPETCAGIRRESAQHDC